jgi:hypothetical protein
MPASLGMSAWHVMVLVRTENNWQQQHFGRVATSLVADGDCATAHLLHGFCCGAQQ